MAYNGCELTDFCRFEELNIVLVNLFQSIEIVAFLVYCPAACLGLFQNGCDLLMELSKLRQLIRTTRLDLLERGDSGVSFFLDVGTSRVDVLKSDGRVLVGNIDLSNLLLELVLLESLILLSQSHCKTQVVLCLRKVIRNLWHQLSLHG